MSVFDPLQTLATSRMIPRMLVIEPNAAQHRAAAMALIVVAASTGAMVAGEWMKLFDGPLLLPVVVAYFLFNFGYLFAAGKARLQTKGARLGYGVVLLNLLAMVLSSFSIVWTALSVCAFLAALVASYLLFQDSRRVAAKIGDL